MFVVTARLVRMKVSKCHGRMILSSWWKSGPIFVTAIIAGNGRIVVQKLGRVSNDGVLNCSDPRARQKGRCPPFANTGNQTLKVGRPQLVQLDNPAAGYREFSGGDLIFPAGGKRKRGRAGVPRSAGRTAKHAKKPCLASVRPGNGTREPQRAGHRV